MKSTIFLLLILELVFMHNDLGYSQLRDRTSARNSFYIELLGVGVLYSLNYDYRFHDHFSVRVGLTSWGISGPLGGGTSLVGVPVMINHLLGKGNHFLETGLGLVINSTTEEEGSVFGGDPPSKTSNHPYYAGSIGYRYQKKDGGFMFRLVFTPLFHWGLDKRTIPTGGISFGFSN